MWSDNETKIDYLGFDHLVDAVVGVVNDESLLPATIGIFGNWGSGKSSLLQMAKEKIQAEAGTLVLEFNGWLFEGAEDAKSALMGTILDEIFAKRISIIKGKNGLAAKAWKLLKRVHIFKIIGPAAKAITLYNTVGPEAAGASLLVDTGGLAKEIADSAKEVSGEDIEKFLRDDPDITFRRSVREFRSDFSHFLEETEIKKLVIIIDDLDRCMPDTIIETLEAIKLFLFVPRTAFILGADERLVQYAVRKRFPELPGERIIIGREYLEKLVQYPIRVPPLGYGEMQTYINLLFAKKAGLDPTAFEKARTRAIVCDATTLLDVRFNAGIAREMFGTVPQELLEELDIAEKISPVLAEGVAGNPRQCKRFLNTLLMRLEMARRRGIALRKAVLAKLMLLEYFKPETFDVLARAQASQGGKPQELQQVEAGVVEPAGINGIAGPQTAHRKAKVAQTKTQESVGASLFEADQWLKDWVRCEPKLSDVDLRPYFFFSRDRQVTSGGAANTLSPQVQELLGALYSDSQAFRSSAVDRFSELSIIDATAVFGAVAKRVRAEENHTNEESSLAILADLAAAKPGFFSQLLTVVVAIPVEELPLWLPDALVLAAQSTEEKASVHQELTRIQSNPTALELSVSIKKALETLAGK